MMHSTLMATRIRSLLNNPANTSFLSHRIRRFFQFRDRGVAKHGNRVLCQISQDAGIHHDRLTEAKHSVATYNSCEDTIAAIATGVQRSAVAVIRVSGVDALSIAKQVFQTRNAPDQWNPSSHRIYVGDAVNSKQEILDEVLCLVFLSPKSYTGEDVVEIQCHGGTACVQRIMTSCIQAGARPARPGEFTFRAFLNGKMDLSQAESVMQLVDAKTVGAADSAMAGLKGGIGKTISSLRATCLDLLVELEARLDFDEDMPELDVDQLNNQISSVMESLESCLKTASQGRLLRDGIQVAIIGRPNVGKSSLMNAWSGVDKAIVTDIPGTTRDVIEADLSIEGVPVKLLDTAGIRKGSDTVEQIGIERASATARGADLVLMVMDYSEGWTENDALVFSSLWESRTPMNGKQSHITGILVANKTDKTRNTSPPSLPLRVSETFESVVLTSAMLGTGIDVLDQAVLDCIGAQSQTSSGVAWAINERQSEALFRAHESLARMTESIKNELPMDLWTIDLREALLCLGEVNGEDLKEEVLDNIFNRFCIGK